MSKTETIIIKLTPELKEKFQQAICSNGSTDVSMSYVLRKMIKHYVEVFEKEGVLIF